MAEVILGNSEQLYLQREGANNIYVDNCQLLKQHQIDGLRFLYIQFKKKKSGIILNFPNNCGKSVTVTLFLYAVRDLLKKPILILCCEDEMSMWKEYFLKWTEYNEDDIVIDPPKLVKGKKVYITNASGSQFYKIHSWSIIVVKEDYINKELSWILDADFKIWLTSTNMKKDLKMLAFIYGWMYPKQKLDINDFIPNKNNKNEMYLKSIHLDYFLDEFVITIDNIEAFNSAKKTKNNAVTNLMPKKSRKNKDATGTKIKRSRKSDDVTTMNANLCIDNDTEQFVFNNNVGKENIIIERSKQNDHLIYDVCKNEAMDTLGSETMTFQNAINDIVKNENCTESINNKIQTDNGEDTKMSTSDFILNSCMERDNLEVASGIVKTENSTESIDFDNKMNEDVKNCEDTETNKSQGTLDSCLYSVQKNCKVIDSNSTMVNGSENLHEISTESMDFDNMNDVQNLEDSNIDIKEVKIDNRPNFIQINKDSKEEIVENIENSKNTIDESFKCHKEEKLSDLEESMLKKFKGSFLDSLF